MLDDTFKMRGIRGLTSVATNTSDKSPKPFKDRMSYLQVRVSRNRLNNLSPLIDIAAV